MYTLNFYLKIHRRMSLKTNDFARANILTLSAEEPTAIANNTAETIVQLPATSRDDEDVDSDSKLEGTIRRTNSIVQGVQGVNRLVGLSMTECLFRIMCFWPPVTGWQLKFSLNQTQKNTCAIMHIAHITKIEREEDKYTVSFVPPLKAPGQPGVYVWPAKKNWSCCPRGELVKIRAPLEQIISAHSDAVRMKFTFSHSDIDYARRYLGVAVTSVH